jgi:hypothetical protein
MEEQRGRTSAEFRLRAFNWLLNISGLIHVINLFEKYVSGPLVHWWNRDSQRQAKRVRQVARASGGKFYPVILPLLEVCPACDKLTLLMVRSEEGSACYNCWDDVISRAASSEKGKVA